MTSVRNLVVHMQLVWCLSKIYYSIIAQLALYVVYYRVLQSYLIPTTQKITNAAGNVEL